MTRPVKFVEVLPPSHVNRPTKPPTRRWLVELRANPGRWAEIARYPRQQTPSARSRAAYHNRTQEDIEAVTRVIGDEIVLFARAVTK